jgi:hypothetical protein
MEWNAGAMQTPGGSLHCSEKPPLESTTERRTLSHLSATQTDKPKQIKLHAKGKAVSIACGYYHTAVVLGSQLGARQCVSGPVSVPVSQSLFNIPFSCRIRTRRCVRRGR